MDSLLAKTVDDSSSNHRSIGSSILYSLHDEFLMKYDFINIAEVQEIVKVNIIVFNSNQLNHKLMYHKNIYTFYR